jgi:hypothetical protein
VYDERWVKVSVVLFERQVVHLDRLVNELRRKDGRLTTRAGLIRGLIDRFIESGADAMQLMPVPGPNPSTLRRIEQDPSRR